MEHGAQTKSEKCMSDKIVSESESESGAVFVESLGLARRLTTTHVTGYAGAQSQTRRVMAVACALELIKTSVAAGAELYGQMQSLGAYADTIEEALQQHE